MTLKGYRGVLSISKLWKWYTVDFLGIFKEMRVSNIPPLRVCLAGCRGFGIHRYHRTFIISTF